MQIVEVQLFAMLELNYINSYIAGVVSTLTEGAFTVTADVTRAVA